MMKKLFFVICFMFCGAVLYAQDVHKKHLIELNFGVVKHLVDEDNKYSTYSTMAYDYAIKDFGVGLGVGLFESRSSGIPNDFKYTSVPIFADFRWMPQLNRTIKFVGVVDGGIVINSSDYSDTNVKHYFSAQAGFRFRVTNLLGINARLVYNNFESFKTTNSIGGIVGLSFSF